MLLPRHFAPRAGVDAAPWSAGRVVHPLDVFVLEGRHTAAAEWVVGLDVAGELTAQTVEPRDALLPIAQSRLSFHEVSGGAPRGLTFDSLHVFQLELVEQTLDAPGLNDAVFLYGTLLGPLAGGPRARCEGQLTVTRGDLLHALVAGAPYAFRHGEGRARGFHMLVPADRSDAVEAGHGAVLVYPTLGQIEETAPGNEALVDQLSYDLLWALWGDVEREQPPPSRRPDELPVPNRALHEQQLATEGYEVVGDTAVRARGGLLGLLGKERRALPKQGTTDEYLALAREALAVLPGWPSASVRALWAQVQPAARAPARWGTAPVVSFAAPPAPAAPARGPRRPPAWIADFVAAHVNERPGAPPPKLTVPAARAARAPHWMDDFAPADGGTTSDEAAKKERPVSDTPDWMKDFGK